MPVSAGRLFGNARVRKLGKQRFSASAKGKRLEWTFYGPNFGL